VSHPPQAIHGRIPCRSPCKQIRATRDAHRSRPLEGAYVQASALGLPNVGDTMGTPRQSSQISLTSALLPPISRACASRTHSHAAQLLPDYLQRVESRSFNLGSRNTAASASESTHNLTHNSRGKVMQGKRETEKHAFCLSDGQSV